MAVIKHGVLFEHIVPTADDNSVKLEYVFNYFFLNEDLLLATFNFGNSIKIVN